MSQNFELDVGSSRKITTPYYCTTRLDQTSVILFEQVETHRSQSTELYLIMDIDPLV